MKHIVPFLFAIIYSISAHSIDLELHSDDNITSASYDLGFDIVTENSIFYFTTGLYRDQFKEYKQIFESEGFYLGIGKHFSINDTLSFSANAKLYESERFAKPVYCFRLIQRLNIF